ncbi:serine--tRNA ligase, partial [Candidatus Zixiibacteriota bacterium]
MLDLKFIRQNPDVVGQAIENKGEEADLDRLLIVDEEYRELLVRADSLKHDRNVVSKQIGVMRAEGQSGDEQMAKMREVSQLIKDLDARGKALEEEIGQIVMSIPNLPHESVPVGRDDADNVEIKQWGQPAQFDFQPLPHWEVGERLDILDLKASSRISGSGFILLKGAGALLERALISFMLDLHTREHGYREVAPPFLVNRGSMEGTGQLPKLAEDMYHCEQDDLFLIPTAEVPVTNIHREEILRGKDLPLNYAAYSACFRREAGSYGKETRGIARVHQFDKVELVKFVRPESSYQELEILLGHAEKVLQLLELPYRVRILCTGDLSFAAAKCYDIEVWAAGQEKFLEVSSCSNFEDFQARRSGIRFREDQGAKAEYVHTLNGSGVALPRTVIAILENYQTSTGQVVIPDILRPYMGGLERID